ncbi:hypothetical protein [Streptococcus sanguinis]|uniref:hypothetical protein n=1 Tax=Streptococcus sanguinis TaxID=1305 RepID=UPI0039C176F2
MPNFAEGTFKIRGKKENIASALKEMLASDTVTISEENDGEELTFTTTNSYFYINGTKRAFFDKDLIEILFEEDFEVIEIDNFIQAWGVIPGDYLDFSKKHGVDIKIFAFEQGLEYSQEVEIINGVIVTNIKRKYVDYQWDVPFSKLGG